MRRAVLLALLGAATAARQVHVGLEASWPTGVSTPVAETFEFLASDATASPWAFLRALATDEDLHRSSLPAYSDEAYEAAAAHCLSVAGRLLGPATANFLVGAVQSRMFAPAVQAHRRVSTESLVSADGAGPCDGDGASGRAWAVVGDGGGAVCVGDDLLAAVRSASESAAGAAATPQVWDFDHAYPARRSGHPLPTIVVHAPDMLGRSFFDLHAAAASLAEGGQALYYLRHGPLHESVSVPTTLPAYGIHLDIKNLEYKTLDDQEEGGDGDGDGLGGEAAGGSTPGTAAAEDFTEEEEGGASADDFPDLDEERLQDLGLQATSYIMGSTDPLRTALRVSQNFPRYAGRVANVVVSEDFREAVRANVHDSMLQLLPGAGTAFYVNGRPVEAGANTFNFYELMDVIHDEVREIERFREILPGVDVESATGILDLAKTFTHDAQASFAGARASVRMDLRGATKGVVSFLNNLEKDEMYERWPRDLVRGIMHAGWQLATVARNIFTIVFVIDPATEYGMAAVRLAQQLYSSMFPVRLGFVLVSGAARAEGAAVQGDGGGAADGISAQMIAAAFDQIQEDHGKPTAFTFLFYLADVMPDGGYQGHATAYLHDVYARALSDAGAFHSVNEGRNAFEDLVREAESAAAGDRRHAFLRATGLPTNCFLLNGLVLSDLDDSDGLMKALATEQAEIGRLIQSGKIKASTKSVYAKLLGNGRSYTRYHPMLVEGSEKAHRLPNSHLDVDGLAFLNGKGFLPPAAVSVIVVADFTDKKVRAVAIEILDAMNGGDLSEFHMRLALVHKPEPSMWNADGTQALASLLSHYHRQGMLDAVKDLFRADGDLLQIAEELSRREGTIDHAQDNAKHFAKFEDLDDAFGAERVVLVANGRKVPLQGQLTAWDVKIAVDLECGEQRASAVRSSLMLLDVSSDATVAKASNFLAGYRIKKRYAVETEIQRQLVVKGGLISSPFALEGAEVRVTCIMDPLSEAAGRILPILVYLRDTLGLATTLFVAPQYTVTALPRKSYFRFVIPGSVQPMAVFSGIPQGQILTMTSDVPESWDVQMKASSIGTDVDNLVSRCDGAKPEAAGCVDETKVLFRLKGILVAGQCYDQTGSRMEPPNGLQLVLRRPDGTVASDTLVMRNLGYWQLKASPGAWSVGLADGRASELFEFAEEVRTNFSVHSFRESIHMLTVRKKAGMEREELLSPAAATRALEVGAGGTLQSVDVGADAAAQRRARSETIHVFSLATGKLYERLLKIMMTSVTKRSSLPVKFWLLENFLSPDFKRRIGNLSEIMGFQYEFVTYKWPMWLRRQTEKQRIIWGYKILFLDVLFPLDVERIIYVDADQVVRGDLAELWHMDLEGKPYAYTPFCTSREETLGFQFWRDGYWKNHLRGLPYHISALYVVDLKTFRATLVGDTLRSIYDNLSRDPNSLSNLDQDLPNFAQMSGVPIFSLPQEWLWCETWCSEGSKKEAKTIDLCNSPLHKEPKLDMARRIISGPLFAESWDELDQLVAEAEAGP